MGKEAEAPPPKISKKLSVDQLVLGLLNIFISISLNFDTFFSEFNCEVIILIDMY
jgi:hypothetical protein